MGHGAVGRGMQSDSRSTQLRLLTLQFEPSLGGFDTRPLDSFVADKELLDVREHFFVVRDLPYLACLVTFRPAARPPEPPSSKPARGRDTLEPADRALFDSLRTWRRERALADGVPPYVLFTDRELAGLVRARPRTRSALQSVPGVGARKVERYGDELLALLIPIAAEPATGEPQP